uniref:COP1-interacting protein 7 n=1 Tax=Physcomitrium patens TaxID=3218 RepID=A0A7I4C758_PHYPA
MKSDVALDHAAFQLTPSRNRCELVVVWGEETERLASGLLKPFLVHLKAAEDQYATGTKEIKLVPPPGYGSATKPETSAWFTKGTIERFVRFVSTPEVLERVGTVEAEIIQLDGAIREHAIESTKADASQSDVAVAAPSAASNILLTATADQAPTPTPSRRNSLDEAENPAPDDNSRRRLLRAMEARKMLLHKEQSMAFARATAAGFDMQKMEHLLVFAECFGAKRLGDACVMFTSVHKKSKESGVWDENEWPLSDTASLRNVPTSPHFRPRESDLWSDMHSEAGDNKLDDLRDDVSVRSYSNYYGEDLSMRAYSGGDFLRKRSPLEGMLSPNRTRDYNGDFSRSRGGSTRTSWDEGSRIAQSLEMAGRAHGDDSLLFSNASSRRITSLGSQHPAILYNGDGANELGMDFDGGNRNGYAQCQRRARESSPQFLAHRFSGGVKVESGSHLLGNDGYHATVQGTLNASNGGSASLHRSGESLPSWAAAASGQSDQPWHPGSIGPSGHGFPRLTVPKFQVHVDVGNGHVQSTLSAEPVVKPPEANGNVLSSSVAVTQGNNTRQEVKVQEMARNEISALGIANVDNSAPSRVDLKRHPVAGRAGDRSQNKPVVRRASSPRRRSSSPMRRVQVGRNSMRRSGVMLKNANYASTKQSGNTKVTPKELEPSDEETDDVPGPLNGSPLQQVHSRVVKQGFGWKDGLRVDTNRDSLAHVSREPEQSPSAASSGWNTPVDYDIDFPENGSEHESTGQPGTLLSPKEPKGRFYEQYREKRDAKLRDGSESRKVDTNAKLKSMEVVLEYRKAEMAARKTRGSVRDNSDGEAQVVAEKSRTPKSDLAKSKKLKSDDEAKRLEEIGNQRRERIAARSSPSPPLAGAASAVSTASTTRATAKQPTTPTAQPTHIPTPSLTPKTKSNAARRLSPSKRVSPGTLRGPVSSPATAAPALKTVRTNQRKSQTAPQTKEVENPMSRSAPSLAELRKENTKPGLPRKSTDNERPRITGSKLPGTRGASTPLEPNGSVVGTRGVGTDDKNRRVGTRKSVAAVADSATEAQLLVPKTPQDEQSATSKPIKRPSPTSAANVESKPFLRKGRGIGPGSGPVVRKSKVGAAPEPSKADEEEADQSISDSEPEFAKAEREVGEEDEDKEASVRPDPIEASQACTLERPDISTTRPSTAPQSLASVLHDDDESIRPEEWQEPEISQDGCSSEDFFYRKSDQDTTRAGVLLENQQSSALRYFSNEGLENDFMVNTIPSGTVTPPPRSSPIHSIPLRSLSPKGSEVPDLHKAHRYSSGDIATSPYVPTTPVAFTDRFPAHDGPFSVPSGAPPLSPETQTSAKLRKNWLNSQKISGPPTVKESTRGLKKLLKFGLKKKDKGSGVSTTSDSPSDIDDDFFDSVSEHGGRTEELTNIAQRNLGSRAPSKASALTGPPAIPEDFATENEDVGSRLISTPRSFFSLSSFRSKVKQ